MFFIAFLAVSLVTIGTIGWFYGRQSVKEETRRRWGEKLRKEIEDAGGVEAWKRKPRVPAPTTGTPIAPAQAVRASEGHHPLEGSLLTARGIWNVLVLTDEDDGRTRRFALHLVSPDAGGREPVPLIIRVPRTVIATERPQTWAADLRAVLADWVNTNAITQGEVTWWPNSPE